MGLSKQISKITPVWFWFIVTIAGSCLPIILRFIVWMCYSIPVGFDLKDVLFAGLAINISNFSLIGEKKNDEKFVILCIAILSIFILGFFLGLLYKDEVILSNKPFPNPFFYGVVILLSVSSMYFSFEANNLVYKTVRKL